MDTQYGVIPERGINSSNEQCIHCGDLIQSGDPVDMNGNYFCCTGCLSVYEFLTNLGLNNYYDIKDTQNTGSGIVPIDPDSDDNYEYLNQKNFRQLYENPRHVGQMNFYIEGIHCAACLWLIEKVPDFVDGVDSVSLNMSSNVATVNFTEGAVVSSFPNTISRIGYKAHPLKPEDSGESIKQRESRTTLIRIAVTAVCAGNIMLLSAAVYAGAEGVFAQYFGLISLFLTVPVVTYGAYPFYKSIMTTLKTLKPTVDIPIVFVIAAGFALSSYNFVRGSDQYYFDSVSVFIFLLLVSRYFLRFVQERLSDTKGLAGSLFSDNRVLLWDSNAHQYFYSPLQELRRGQKVMLKKGDRIPCDGTLVSTDGVLNLSVLTGENIPQTVLRNDQVYAGSIVESDEVELKVLETGKSTRIGAVLEQVEKSFTKNSGFVSYSDQYATVFTAFVCIVSIVSFFTLSYIYGTSSAINRVIAFILISCPCAFVFALPLAKGFSLKSALTKGFLVKNGDIFDNFMLTRRICFDKTGTLTKGRYTVLCWDTNAMTSEDLAAVLAIERESSHPVARTMVSYLSDSELMFVKVSGFKQIPARGIEATVGIHTYRLESAETENMKNDVNSIITTKINIYKDDVLISDVLLGDTLKADAKFVIDELKSRGYEIYILSGDTESNVIAVSEKLCIDQNQIHWGQTPEDKLKFVSESPGCIMVGDGLNDAGALAGADIGIAIQGSVEESLNVSDVYVLNNDLFTILDVIDHGVSNRITVKRNIVFSVLYNTGAGVLALLGFINPLVAAVLMPISSLVLTGSSYLGSTNKLKGVNKV